MTKKKSELEILCEKNNWKCYRGDIAMSNTMSYPGVYIATSSAKNLDEAIKTQTVIFSGPTQVALAWAKRNQKKLNSNIPKNENTEKRQNGVLQRS
jgi:hypothetical protein